MNNPVIPKVFLDVKAPKVSRTFYRSLRALSLWPAFVGAFKLYARLVKPSRIITLDPEVEGGPRIEYMHRWHIIPRNRFFNLYLHKFVHGDDDRALHDHPWNSASLILDGRYKERTRQFCYTTAPERTEESVGAHVLRLYGYMAPLDGRSYVSGSLENNLGKFEGLHKLDYVQAFKAGDFRRLEASHMHLIELYGNNDEPCWTLFATGPIIRRWGFACPTGWRDFKDYLSDHPSKPGHTTGCD